MEEFIDSIVNATRASVLRWTLSDTLRFAASLGYTQSGIVTFGRYSRIDLTGVGGGPPAFVRLVDGKLVVLYFYIHLFQPSEEEADESANQRLRQESLIAFRDVVNAVTTQCGEASFVGTPLDSGYPPDHAAARVAVWNVRWCRLLVYWDYEERAAPTLVGICLGEMSR